VPKYWFLKLICFQGYSHTYFLVYLGVSLIDFSKNGSFYKNTATHARTIQTSKEKKWKGDETTVNIIQNQRGNGYEYVTFLRKIK
jgi:hypothetical protein